MPDLGLTNLPIILALIVPGFVWWTVHRYLQLVKREPKQTWLGMFSRSAVNYALWFWLIPDLWGPTARHLHSFVLADSGTGAIDGSLGWWTMMGWILVLLVSPTVLGFMTARAERSGWVRRFLMDRLGLSIPHPVEAAWDYRFGDSAPMWVTVTLTDGSIVEGVFSDHSMASTAPDERDLYLESHYELDEGVLKPMENDAGIWIRADMIKAITFKKLKLSEDLT